MSPLSKQSGYPEIKTGLKFLHSYPLRPMQQKLNYSISTELAMSWGVLQVLESDWFLQYSSTVLMFETTAIAIRFNGFYEQLSASEGTAEWNNKSGSSKMNSNKKTGWGNKWQGIYSKMRKPSLLIFTADYTPTKLLISYNHVFSLLNCVTCSIKHVKLKLFRERNL